MTPDVPPLRAHTVEVTDRTGPEVDLLTLVPESAARSVCSWVREGDGIVAWGRAASCATTGRTRFADAERWWADVSAAARVDDEVQLPGTGLLAFGSFTFAPESADDSRLVVPEVVVGRREGRVWLTTVARAGDEPEPVALRPEGDLRDAPPTSGTTYEDGSVSSDKWPAVVARAVEHIDAGEVHKVVLARDVLARTPGAVDLRHVLRRLAGRYAATWTFAVDGLVGATPEMLVRLLDGRARSRVLAGTVRRDSEPAPLVTEAHPELATPHASDPRLRLISSDKDLEEHAFAVRSVADSLAPHCRDLQVPDEPFVLELPDVYHLATDLTGTAVDGTSSLRLAAALHPSAAVCGTPADVAARVIAELEEMDRGRYAGPVGWVDARGEGDWGIALRCGELQPDGSTVRLFAGGGIVAASDPDSELAETEIKLAAMRHALSG